MNWDKCQFFKKHIQCKNNIHKNGVCLNHINKTFKGEYIFTCLSGEGYIYPNKLCNQRDIVSFENIWEYKDKLKVANLDMQRELLFSFVENNKLYGVNILSLVNNVKLFVRTPIENIEIKNPFSKINLSIMNIIRLKLKIQYLIDFNHPLIIKETINTNPFNKLLNIIIKLENEGFFFDPSWYQDLSCNQIKNIINETKLIWNEYNSPLNFNYQFTNINLLHLVNFYEHILTIENMTITSKILIILGGLAYVISDVKIVYPDLVHE